VASQHTGHQALVDRAGVYLQKLITDMEYEQIAESIVSVTKRVAVRRITPSISYIQSEAASNKPAIIRTAKKATELDGFLYLLSFD